MSQIGNPLDEIQINNALNSAYWRVKVVEETGSTQSDMSQNVRDGNGRSGDVLVAEYQYSGRGRLDRTFVAPPRSALLFSFLYLPQQINNGDAHFGWLPLLAGQAVRHSLLSIAPTELESSITLKWPNDVLIHQKKVAGVLCERVNVSGAIGVIFGIGINVSSLQNDLPIQSATSLVLEKFSDCDRGALLVSILQSMTRYLKRWELGDESLLGEYVACSSTIGMEVRAEMPNGVVHESVAVGIEKTGSLILEDNTCISVGDVIHLR